MSRSSERRPAAWLVAACLGAACGGGEPSASPPSPSPPSAPVEVAQARAPAQPAAAGPQATHAPAAPRTAPVGAIGERELVNPEGSAVVLLYYHLAALTPPFDTWVEEDGRVQRAPAIEKKVNREAVRAELEAAAAAVHGVGALRITMNADLSDYDPTYGEFTVRALAPSRYVSFEAFKQKIAVKFTNGLDAQTWRVPEAEAQAIRDRLGPMRRVSLDALLRIQGVQPTPGGGTFDTEIVEYELRLEPSGQRLARVKLVGAR